MHLAPERVETFKKLYKAQLGIALNDQEALDKAIHLVSLVRVVLKESARHVKEWQSLSPLRLGS